MDKLLFVVMVVILVYVSIKNFTLVKRYNHNKKYISAYQDVLYGKENGYQNLTSYIDGEKSEEYKNKARIIKLYYELDNNLDYSETLDSLNLKEIFYQKDKVNDNTVNINSDSFAFIMLAMSKANCENKKEVVEALCNKVIELDKLADRLECKEIVAFNNALLNKEDEGIEFMNKILAGDYAELKYDKGLILLYKRFAAATLAYENQELDEYFRNDLSKFSEVFIGKMLLNNLKIYEMYKPVEEAKDETEQVEETKE